MPRSHVKVRLDVTMIEVPSDSQKERVRRDFESSSTLSKFRKGIVSVGFYAMATFPRVLVNHYIRKKPLNPDWSAFEETTVRTVKWLLDAPLATSRTNSGTLEFLYKTFRCPEPLQKVRGVPGVRGYWFGPQTWKGRKAEATILYLHGGGYVASTSLWGTIPLCYLLKTLRKKHNIHARVLAIDYPLAPENMYPHAVNCAERAYRWLVEESGLPGSQQVFVAGDSAGGGLCLSLLQCICGKEDKKSNLQSPLGAILISPWVDLACASTSYRTNAKYDILPPHYTSLAAEYYVFGHEKSTATIERPKESMFQDQKYEDQVLNWLQHVEESLSAAGLGGKLTEHENKYNSVLKDQPKVHQTPKLKMPAEDQQKSSKNMESPYKDPMISPVNASTKVLSHLPPMVVSYGGKEIFKDDIETFIHRLQEAKARNTDSGGITDVKVIYDKDMVHVYPVLLDLFGARARLALKEMCKFMSTQLRLSALMSPSPLPLLKAETISSKALPNTLPDTLPMQHSSQSISRKPSISMKQSISSKQSSSTKRSKLSKSSIQSNSTKQSDAMKQADYHVYKFLKNLASPSPSTHSSAVIQTVTDDFPNSRRLPSVVM